MTHKLTIKLAIQASQWMLCLIITGIGTEEGHLRKLQSNHLSLMALACKSTGSNQVSLASLKIHKVAIVQEVQALQLVPKPMMISNIWHPLGLRKGHPTRCKSNHLIMAVACNIRWDIIKS